MRPLSLRSLRLRSGALRPLGLRLCTLRPDALRQPLPLCLVGAMLLAVPGVAHAQAITAEALAQRIAEWRKTMVQVRGASTVTVDPTAHTATVHLYNPQEDTVVVDVTLQFAEPKPMSMPTAEALLTDDSLKEDSVRRAQATSDSLEKLWSLADWVQEPLPVRLWLAPHQTVSLTLHLTVPSTVKPGTYSTYVTVRTVQAVDVTNLANMTAAAMDMALTGSYGGHTFKKSLWLWDPRPELPSAMAKVVYTAGATVN